METYEIKGYAHWATFLVNGDRDNVSGADLNEIRAWLKANDASMVDCIDARDEAFFGQPEGLVDALPGMLCEYTFVCR